MKLFYIGLLVTMSFVTMSMSQREASPANKPIYDLANAKELFEKFVKDYHREYKDENDRRLHFEAFVKTLKTVNEKNSDPDSDAVFGINKFADYTYSERAKLHGLGHKARRSSIAFEDHHHHQQPHQKKPIYDLDKAEELFEKFIKDYNKLYLDEEDKKLHFEVFKNTLIEINDKNSDDSNDVKVDITKFADFTEEDRARLDGLRHRKSLVGNAAYEYKPIYDLTKAEEIYEKFIKDYNRTYKNEKDKLMHFEAFKKTLEEINARNSYKLGRLVFDINRFADYTHKEKAKFSNVGISYRRKVGFRAPPVEKLSSASMVLPEKPFYDLQSAEFYFEKFVKDYNRHYDDDEDRAVHFEAFKKTLEDINRRNSHPGGNIVFDINQFADYTEEERAQLSGLKYRKK